MAAVDSPLAPITNGVSRTNGALNGNGDLHDGITDPAISFDPSVFRSYLFSLLPPIFGVPPEELESIFDEDFHDRVSRFAGEGGGVVYIVKKRDEQDSEQFVFSLRMTPLMSLRRGRPAHILLQAHSDPHLRSLSCHDSCYHQTRSYPRPHFSFGYTITNPQPFW